MMRPTFLWALAALALTSAAPRSAAATQVVFLDFLTLGGSNINYTPTMEADVKTGLESKFAGFDVDSQAQLGMAERLMENL